jgi:hypothetical protein
MQMMTNNMLLIEFTKDNIKLSGLQTLGDKNKRHIFSFMDLVLILYYTFITPSLKLSSWAI